MQQQDIAPKKAFKKIVGWIQVIFGILLIIFSMFSYLFIQRGLGLNQQQIYGESEPIMGLDKEVFLTLISYALIFYEIIIGILAITMLLQGLVNLKE